MYRLTTMSFRAAIVLSLIAPAVSLSAIAAAQSSGCGSLPNALSLAAGVAQSNRLDVTASPVQFDGRGGDVVAGFDHSLGGFCVVSSAHGGIRTLSAASGSAAKERLIDADAGIALLRGVSGSAQSRNWFGAGVELRGNIAATDHAYADPQATVSQFRMGVASLGPAALWRVRLGSNAATVQLSSPLVAVVDHPYSAVWSKDAWPHLRAATIAQLRGVNGAISYSFAPDRRVTPTATYRFSALRYDDVRPVRALTQSLSIGVRVRLSSPRP